MTAGPDPYAPASSAAAAAASVGHVAELATKLVPCFDSASVQPWPG